MELLAAIAQQLQVLFWTAFISSIFVYRYESSYNTQYWIHKNKKNRYHMWVSCEQLLFQSSSTDMRVILIHSIEYIKIKKNNTCKYCSWAFIWKVTRFGFVRRQNNMNHWSSLGSITNGTTLIKLPLGNGLFNAHIIRFKSCHHGTVSFTDLDVQNGAVLHESSPQQLLFECSLHTRVFVEGHVLLKTVPINRWLGVRLRKRTSLIWVNKISVRVHSFSYMHVW